MKKTGILLTFGLVVSVALGTMWAIRISSTDRQKQANIKTFSEPANNNVLHARVSVSTQGNPSISVVNEIWIVSGTNETKYQIYDASGAPAMIAAREGLTTTIYTSATQELNVNVSPTDDAPMLGIASRFLSYKRMVDQGLPIQAHGSIQGRPTVRIGYSFDDENNRHLTLSTWLDEATLLPMQEVYTNTETSAPIETINLMYDTLEYIDRNALSSDFFKVMPPPGTSAGVATDRYMTITETHGFDQFDIYWLGNTFGDLPINPNNGFVYSHSSPSAVQQTNAPIFSVNYQQSYGDEESNPKGKVEIVQEPANMHTPTETYSPTTSIQITNPFIPQAVLTGTLYTDDTRLETQIGGTFITILGRNDQDMIAAAAVLRKLNQ